MVTNKTKMHMAITEEVLKVIDTGKRHCLYSTVLSGFSYRIMDCYGIPGSKRLLDYTVPYYRKWYHPLTRYTV